MSDLSLPIDVGGRRYEIFWPVDPDDPACHDHWRAIAFAGSGEYVGYLTPPPGGFGDEAEVLAAAQTYLTAPTSTTRRVLADIRGCITALRAAIAESAEASRRSAAIVGGSYHRDDYALARHAGYRTGLLVAIDALNSLLAGYATEECRDE